MAVDHSRIDRLLGKKADRADNSLRAQSLARAVEEKVPTTLTPYEWEQWYAEHGVPVEHQAAQEKVGVKKWWHRLLGKRGER